MRGRGRPRLRLEGASAASDVYKRQVGIQGAEGARGPTGTQGPQGNLGATGPQGSQGEVGAQGARGDIGPRGPTGPKGPAGDKGPDGDDGTNGTNGANGTDGADGRSSSGKLYDISRVDFSSSDAGVAKTLLQVNVVQSQTFERVLKVANIFGTKPSTGVAVAEIRLRRSGSAGYTDGGPLSLTGGAGLINPLDAFGNPYITIPANWIGTITVEGYCTSTTTTFSIRAGKDTAINGLVEVSLIPTSTELT